MTIPILWMRKLRPGEGKQPTQDYPARYWQKCFTDSDVLTCRPLSLPAGLSLESGPFPHEGPAEELAGPGAPLVLPGAERGQLPPAWARQPRPQGRGASAMREPGEQTARPSEQGSSRGAHFQGLLDLPRLTSSPCTAARGGEGRQDLDKESGLSPGGGRFLTVGANLVQGSQELSQQRLADLTLQRGC